MKKSTWITLAAVAVAVVIGVGVAGYLFLSGGAEEPATMPYGPDKRQAQAEALVAGLNTRDPKQVPVSDNGSATPEATTAREIQRRAVRDVMPADGCRYTLTSVEDRGQQGRRIVPEMGPTTEQETWRFDMHVDEQCAGRPAREAVIGVVAIPVWRYWEPVTFEP